jgi:hypothetical protein
MDHPRILHPVVEAHILRLLAEVVIHRRMARLDLHLIQVSGLLSRLVAQNIHTSETSNNLGPDPVFRPNDPPMNVANYPQPPYSSHNQAPSPVPYGQNSPGQQNSQFYMHVHPQLQNRPPPAFQLSNCKYYVGSYLNPNNVYNILTQRQVKDVKGLCSLELITSIHPMN